MVPILAHLDQDIFDLRVCALQSKDGNPIAEEIKDLGIPVDELEIRHMRDISNVPELRLYYNTHEPDLIHTQLEFADTLGTAAANILRIPCVSTLHTLGKTDPDVSSVGRQRLKWFFLRNFCDRIIAVSEQTRQYHIEYGKIDPKKIVTIYNGIIVDRFASIPPDTRTKTRAGLGIPDHSLVVTTVAVLRKPKGIDYMLEAVPALVSKFPNLIYLLIGDGPHRPAIEERITRLGISDHVILTGQRNDIPELLTAADLFVLPTLTDALPTVLFEALASSLPVVATDIGGIPEIITDKHDGYLVPSQDVDALVSRISKLLDDKKSREIFKINGLRKVRSKFDINVQVKNLTSLYKEVLRENR